MAFDSTGTLYVAYSGSDIIEKFTPAGVGSVFASGLHDPQGIAFDSAGNLYVANDSSGSSAENGFPDTIEKITPQGVASTFSTEVSGPTFIATSTTNVNITKIVSLSTGTITFGSLLAGAGRAQSLTITNTGNAPLVVTGITYTGANGAFSGDWSGTLAPGANSGSITITFNPTEIGNYSGVGTVLSNATSGSNTFTLTGLAGNTPTFTSADTATFTVGIPISFTVSASSFPASTYSAISGLPSWATLDPNTGVITGTPPDTTGSPFSPVLEASDGVAQTYQFPTFTVVSPPAPVTFSAWQMLTGISSGPIATPLNDGVSNLLKYLFHINPTAPMSATDRTALPTVGTIAPGGIPYLTLTYRQYAPESGITVNVQTSPDLQTWTTVATDSTPTLSILEAGVSLVQTGNDPATGDPIMQAQVPLTGIKCFIRLEVTQP
jgi:hypothetical protein